ncbi:MAG: recombinase family protein [Clostridia bacterium]|nr:recombinase family protein [Clostridia bacterium]
MEDNQKAGGYIRIDKKTDETQGIEGQKQTINSFAREKGLDVIGYYVDEAEEATPLDKRVGYAELNNDIVAGKINAVVMSSLDRAAADDREFHGLMHNFAEKGIEVYIASTGEYINPSEPLTREQRLLGEAMRQTEQIRAEQVRERIKEDEVKH